MTRASPSFVHGLWQVALRNLSVWRSYAVSSALGNFGEPILYLLAMGFGLGRVVPPIDGMSYAEFIAPGLVCSTVMYTATFEGTFGCYTRMATQGTFGAILATPVTVDELVVGEIVWGAIKATFGSAAVLLVISAFGLVSSYWALFMLPLAFVAGLLFTAAAMAITSLTRGYESFNYYFTLVAAPMFLFSGVFFPLDRTPSWVATAAMALPLTHVVAVARLLAHGCPDSRIWLNCAVLVAFLLVIGAVTLVAMRHRMRV